MGDRGRRCNRYQLWRIPTEAHHEQLFQYRYERPQYLLYRWMPIDLNQASTHLSRYSSIKNVKNIRRDSRVELEIRSSRRFIQDTRWEIDRIWVDMRCMVLRRLKRIIGSRIRS